MTRSARVRRGLAALAAVTALALAGCARTDAADAGAQVPGPRGAVVVSGPEPASQLLPATSADDAAATLVDALWTGLVTYDDDGRPVLAHALSVETTDNIVWTVRLRPGWTFHDGTPVTARSYVDAWNWAADCRKTTAFQPLFGPAGADIAGFATTAGTVTPAGTVECSDQPVPLSGVAAVDDATIAITLAHPVAELETILGHRAFAPLPPGFFADPDAFARKPIGNGPFRFTGRTPGEQVLLTAAQGYPGADAPQVETLTWRVHRDATAAYRDLLAGTVDVLPAVPAKALADGSAERQVGSERLTAASDGSITVLNLPIGDARFASPLLRQALSRAVDRASIADAALRGRTVPADAWTPPRIDGAVPGACGATCRFDVAAARDLLARAGGFDGDLVIGFGADGGDEAWVAAVCRSITDTLAIPCRTQPYPTEAALRDAVSRGELQGAYPTTWRTDYPSVANLLDPAYGDALAASGDPAATAAFDALLATARRVPRPDANVAYAKAQDILTATVPAVPLWLPLTVVAATAKVEGVAVMPSGTLDIAALRVRTTAPESG